VKHVQDPLSESLVWNAVRGGKQPWPGPCAAPSQSRHLKEDSWPVSQQPCLRAPRASFLLTDAEWTQPPVVKEGARRPIRAKPRSSHGLRRSESPEKAVLEYRAKEWREVIGHGGRSRARVQSDLSQQGHVIWLAGCRPGGRHTRNSSEVQLGFASHYALRRRMFTAAS